MNKVKGPTNQSIIMKPLVYKESPYTKNNTYDEYRLERKKDRKNIHYDTIRIRRATQSRRESQIKRQIRRRAAKFFFIIK